MKKLILLVVMASLLAVVAVSPPGVGARKPRPWVVCVTQWDPHPRSTYRRTPAACDFHERGKGYYHVYIQVARHLRWHYWNGRRALGHGKLGVSTYGWAPVRVKLSRPRQVCGRKVFTKGRFKIRLHYNSRTYTDRYRVPLDKCTR